MKKSEWLLRCEEFLKSKGFELHEFSVAKDKKMIMPIAIEIHSMWSASKYDISEEIEFISCLNQKIKLKYIKSSNFNLRKMLLYIDNLKIGVYNSLNDDEPYPDDGPWLVIMKNKFRTKCKKKKKK